MQNKGLNVSVRSFITAIAVIFALMIAAFVLYLALCFVPEAVSYFNKRRKIKRMLK
jgi:hypothetical protein